MARSFVVLLAFLAACTFSGGEGTSIDAALVDSGADAVSADANSVRCARFANGVELGLIKPDDVLLSSGGAYLVDLSGINSPSLVTISDGIDNVVVGARLHSFMETEMVIVEMGRFEIAGGSTLRITGDRPVILISHTDIVVDGLIDIGGGCRDQTPNQSCAGPGGAVGPQQLSETALGCAPGGNGGGNNGGGTPEHGGGGGGFGGSGSDGGGDTGGTGGAACADQSLEPLVGGSSGGAGGVGTGGGDGGGGGGAVQLSAAQSIEFRNQNGATPSGINGGGGGGGAGEFSDGGGGGGAGGAILLEAASIDIGELVVLAANGGGGGGGGGGASITNGVDGTLSLTSAAGGVGDFMGGRGGSALAMSSDGDGDGSDDDTGGGGGGVGVIQLRAPTTAMVTNDGGASPNATFVAGCDPI